MIITIAVVCCLCLTALAENPDSRPSIALTGGFAFLSGERLIRMETEVPNMYIPLDSLNVSDQYPILNAVMNWPVSNSLTLIAGTQVQRMTSEKPDIESLQIKDTITTFMIHIGVKFYIGPSVNR